MATNVPVGPDAELPIRLAGLGMGMRPLGRRRPFFILYLCVAWHNILEGIVCLFEALSKYNVLSM